LSQKIIHSEGFKIVNRYFESLGNTPFGFQVKTWDRYMLGYSGMVIAPTGFGKTFSVFMAVLIDYMNHPERYQKGLNYYGSRLCAPWQRIWLEQCRPL
jgi:ATP-dependent Lhr-like helicase